MSYLGKISAIVSANTADFQSKLSASARDVSKFARAVQGDLARASSNAASSLANIYTPLQKVERALRAANSLKLSFKGFDGAIRNVDELNQRLAELSRRQIEVNVRGTGFKTVTDLRDAIRGITAKDVSLVASVGGLQQARELLAAMKALDAQGERRGVVFGRDAGTGTAVKIGQQQLDETLAKFGKLQDLKQIDLAVRVIGGRQAEEAQDRLRKSVSLQYGVTDPLQRVKEQVMALPEAIQREVNPAFVGLQARVERAAGAIDKFKAVSSRTFNKLAGDVNVAREAMSRLTVASEQANAAIARGPGAPPPELTRTLARNVELNEALPTRPTFISQRDDVVELNARRVRSIERLMVLYARYENEQAQGGATAKTTRQFREQIQVVNGLADALNELVYASDASAFDELALQANKAVAVFSRLTPEASRGLVALQNHALGLLDSYRRTGEGVESATDAVKRFAAAADIRDAAQRIKQVGDGIGGQGGFQAVENSIGRVKAAFDALPDSIRGKFSPEVRAAILGAADLGFSLEAVGTKGEKAIERVLAQLGRLRGRLAASAEAGGIAGNLEQTLPRVRATPAVNLRTIASGINDAVAQLDSLAAPLRRRVAPAFKETIERAIELARTIESSGRSNVTDINSVANSVKRLSAELRAAKADAELSNSGLFGSTGGSRGVDSLNQEVRSLSDAFRLLPANSRAALVPFVTQVKEARSRLREGTGGVREYQAAVSSLAAALKSIQSTSAAFTGDSTAAGRAKAVEQLETRINAASQASESFGRAGTRSLQEVANAAKVAAAEFAAGVGPISAAERAVALLETRVQELQRSEGVSKLFRVGAEPTKLEQFGGLVGKLDERFNALGLDSRRALKGLGEGLRQAYAAALDSGRATASLTQAYEALLNAVLEVEGAEETRRARNAVASARFLTVLPDAGDEAAARQAAARRLIGTEARGPTELPRSLEALGGKIASIRSELESLPKPLQKSLLPILRSLSAEFVAVAGSVKPSKKELQSLIQQAAILEKLLSGSRSQDQTRRNQVAGRQDIAFSLTGRAQNLDQAKTDLNRLIGLIQDLDAAKRKAFAPTLRAISDLIATGDKAKLKDIVSLLRTLDADLNKERRLEINSKDAKKRLDDIRAALASVSSTLTGKTADPFAALDQSAARAKQAVDRLADSKRKTTLQGRITAIESQNAQDVIAARNQTLTPGELARRARGRSRSLDAIAGSAEKQVVTDVFGPAVGSSAQKVDALKSRISSLQASIAALPRPIQSALVPELNKARDAFFNLSKTPTKAEINQILKLVNGLELSFKRAAAAAKFGESFASFLRGSAEERYTSKLQAIRQAMAAIGITAKGPVASAINDYGTALAAASSKGKLATQATAAAMDKLLQKIADAAVASGKLSKAQAAAFVANVKNAGVGRSGDVSRLGVDKFTLGLQQAGFALDDFFSATGGIDQKIRAISNNISQLGFIVGGTEGLFLALGVTIGAQVALGIQKFVNGGRTAEDQTNALNEALARQKSLIEELGQAFESFATALSKGTFSRQAAEARDFEKQIREIAKKQKEQRESRLIDLSPEVQRERAEQKRIDRELEGATDAGQRVALIAQREASKKREEAAAKAAVAVPLPAKEQVLDTVQRTIRANEFLVGGKLTAFSEGAAQARREKAAADVAAADTVDKQAAVVRERLAERRDVAAKPIGVFNFEQNAEIIRAREDVAALETLLASLEEQIKANGNALAVSILEASIPIAKSLEQTQKLLDEAIFPFSETRKQADKIAKELESVVTELKTASDPNRIQELEQQQQALRSQAAATNAAAQALRSFADVVNRISTSLVNQVAEEARSNADSARRAANEAAGVADVNGEFGPNGERRRPGDAQRDAARRADEARQAADEARRAQDEAIAVRQRNEDRQREFENGNAPEAVKFREDIAKQQAIIDDAKSTEKQKQEAQREIDRLKLARQRAFEDSAVGQQAAEEANRADRNAAAANERARQAAERNRAADRGRDAGLPDSVRAARDARNTILDIQEAERQKLITKQQSQDQQRRVREQAIGDIGLTDAEKAAKSAREGLETIVNFRDEKIIDPAEAQRRAQRFAQEQARNAAPMIFQFADSVENAVLQGPSRQALHASDISTMEGQSELNRLLRGDDEAKNVNLVELRKQNESLTKVVQELKNIAQAAGIPLTL